MSFSGSLTVSKVLKQDVWSLGKDTTKMFVLIRQDKLHHKQKNKLSNRMISRSATHHIPWNPSNTCLNSSKDEDEEADFWSLHPQMSIGAAPSSAGAPCSEAAPPSAALSGAAAGPSSVPAISNESINFCTVSWSNI